MRIHPVRETRVFLVTIEGRFTAHEMVQFGTAVVEQIDEDAPDLVLDLSAVEFMDASAVGGLVRARTRAVECGGSLTLAAVSPAVRLLLDLITLHEVFVRADSVAAARLLLSAA